MNSYYQEPYPRIDDLFYAEEPEHSKDCPCDDCKDRANKGVKQ